MSLYEPADGILETHVTWEDVEADLQKKFGTKASFGENKKATNISDLKGFMSRIALVEPDWQNVEEGKQLPEKFALKVRTQFFELYQVFNQISSQLALHALSKIMNFEGGAGFSEEKMKHFAKLTKECHNREVEVYKLLMRFNHPNIPYTKVYSLKSFDDDDDLKGYLIVDFVSNIHEIEMFQNIPADDLFPLVRGIATFSALTQSLSLEETSFALGQNYLEMLFGEFLNEAELNKKFDRLESQFEEKDKENVEKLVKVFNHYKSLVKKYTTISETLNMALVLNHGDLWQSNVIHSLNEDGTLKLEAMIDWQGVSRMPPGLDLSRLLLGCLSLEDRRTRGTEILNCYYETFTKVHGKELFTFQELQDCYNLFAPMMAMLLLPDMHSFIDNNTRVSEEMKVIVRKDTTKKMRAIMDDILEIHEYNLEHYPDFMRID
uniref:CHK domain-containing protein n=1 Tax=Caenorhabditis tropicalis TaxID=1561998 RepID=A0A1I7U7Y3_9PELO